MSRLGRGEGTFQKSCLVLSNDLSNATPIYIYCQTTYDQCRRATQVNTDSKHSSQASWSLLEGNSSMVSNLCKAPFADAGLTGLRAMKGICIRTSFITVSCPNKLFP